MQTNIRPFREWKDVKPPARAGIPEHCSGVTIIYDPIKRSLLVAGHNIEDQGIADLCRMAAVSVEGVKHGNNG